MSLFNPSGTVHVLMHRGHPILAMDNAEDIEPARIAMRLDSENCEIVPLYVNIAKALCHNWAVFLIHMRWETGEVLQATEGINGRPIGESTVKTIGSEKILITTVVAKDLEMAIARANAIRLNTGDTVGKKILEKALDSNGRIG